MWLSSEAGQNSRNIAVLGKRNIEFQEEMYFENILWGILYQQLSKITLINVHLFCGSTRLKVSDFYKYTNKFRNSSNEQYKIK